MIYTVFMTLAVVLMIAGVLALCPKIIPMLFGPKRYCKNCGRIMEAREEYLQGLNPGIGARE